MTSAQMAVIGVLGLIGMGVYGLLITRNLIKVVIAIQILGKGALLALVAAGSVSGKINLGQSLAVVVIVVDTIVAVIGLALALQVKRRMGTLDVKELSTLKR
jgi:NADH-quinone oxidoreductase subunit K